MFPLMLGLLLIGGVAHAATLGIPTPHTTRWRSAEWARRSTTFGERNQAIGGRRLRPAM